MAPTKGGKTSSAKGSNKKSSAASKSMSSSKSKKPSGLKPKPVQQKTKAPSRPNQKKKKRVYTDKELGIPLLNSIKPAGIQKPHGTKKGKNFVDDKESMMAILAMVQAEKEGNIESKMMRARQMEEIRQARKAELEKREAEKKGKLEERKDDLRKRKNKTSRPSTGDDAAQAQRPKSYKPAKRVSFG